MEINNFSGKARKVLMLAKQEALRFNHKEVVDFHLLLGLAKEGSTNPLWVALNIDWRRIRLDIESRVSSGVILLNHTLVTYSSGLTRIYELARDHAGHGTLIEPKDLLLALTQSTDSVVVEVFSGLGITLEKVQDAIRLAVERQSQKEAE